MFYNLMGNRGYNLYHKVVFFDQRLRDEIYSCRLKLKRTNIYISEDLTQKKSFLAYEARQYVKSTENTRTWTEHGTVFLKKTVSTANHKPFMTRKISNRKTLRPPPTIKYAPKSQKHVKILDQQPPRHNKHLKNIVFK